MPFCLDEPWRPFPVRGNLQFVYGWATFFASKLASLYISDT